MPWIRRQLAPLLLLLPAAASALAVEPNPVRIGTFVDRQRVQVRGAAEPGEQICVAIAGRTVEERFNRKGRIGPVWANVGSVTISGVPSLYLVACSAPPRQLVDADAADRNLLDLDAVARQARVGAQGSDAALLQREYVRLKEKEGVFGSFDHGVRLTAEGGAQRFDASLPWPTRAPGGAYAVRVYHLRDGMITRQERASLGVEIVGLPRFLAHMAFDRSALYGFLSVVVALAVGFAMGMVFKKGGGH